VGSGMTMKSRMHTTAPARVMSLFLVRNGIGPAIGALWAVTMLLTSWESIVVCHLKTRP